MFGNEPENFEINGFTLIRTCWACPEQYDALFRGQEIGYLRLRHGHFYCEYTPTDKRVFEAQPNGDGIFDDDEREEYLTKAINALKEEMDNAE